MNRTQIIPKAMVVDLANVAFGLFTSERTYRCFSSGFFFPELPFHMTYVERLYESAIGVNDEKNRVCMIRERM